MHFHWRKREDIINRGGGNLIIELWNAGAHEETENTDVTVTVDGCRQTHTPGSQLRLTPWESICLTPGLYHSFWGERGFGDVLVGEVSSVNDDEHDNHFYSPLTATTPLKKTNRRCWCCATSTTCFGYKE